MSDGFLSRWSRRKTLARESPEALDSLDVEADNSVSGKTIQTPETTPVLEPADNAVQREVAPLTEDDLKRVEEGGDIKAFLTDKVSSELKNKAFKALFSRPEFNVMDGLDIYIDDYNKFTPLSQTDIGKMALSRELLSRPDLEVQKSNDLLDGIQTAVGAPAAELSEKQSSAEPVDDQSVDQSLESLIENEPRVYPESLQVTDSEKIYSNRDGLVNQGKVE